MKTLTQLACTLILCGTLSPAAIAAVVHDEGVDGDLSNDNTTPTAISLAPGSNLIIGSHTNNPLDRDLFTITINAGEQLDSLVLAAYTNTDDQSFLGFEEGNTFTDFFGSGATFNFALIGADAGVSLGDDLLDDVAGGPLGAGVYSFWLQETGGVVTYTLDLQVSAMPVPEPVALPLFAAGLLLVGAAVRRRNSA